MRLRKHTRKLGAFQAWNKCLNHLLELARAHVEAVMLTNMLDGANKCEDLDARKSIKVRHSLHMWFALLLSVFSPSGLSEGILCWAAVCVTLYCFKTMILMVSNAMPALSQQIHAQVCNSVTNSLGNPGGKAMLPVQGSMHCALHCSFARQLLSQAFFIKCKSASGSQLQL